MGISTIPDGRWYLVVAAPGKEMFFVICAAREQEPGTGKILRIAPDASQAPAGLIDKIAQVLLPAAIKIAKEQHPLVVVDHYPAGEMDGRDPHQLPVHEEVPDKGAGKQHQS